MIELLPDTAHSLLVQRLERGAELLFDMEQRGDTGVEYDRFYRHFARLLAEYEDEMAAQLILGCPGPYHAGRHFQ